MKYKVGDKVWIEMLDSNYIGPAIVGVVRSRSLLSCKLPFKIHAWYPRTIMNNDPGDEPTDWVLVKKKEIKYRIGK